MHYRVPTIVLHSRRTGVRIRCPIPTSRIGSCRVAAAEAIPLDTQMEYYHASRHSFGRAAPIGPRAAGLSLGNMERRRQETPAQWFRGPGPLSRTLPTATGSSPGLFAHSGQVGDWEEANRCVIHPVQEFSLPGQRRSRCVAVSSSVESPGVAPESPRGGCRPVGSGLPPFDSHRRPAYPGGTSWRSEMAVGVGLG